MCNRSRSDLDVKADSEEEEPPPLSHMLPLPFLLTMSTLLSSAALTHCPRLLCPLLLFLPFLLLLPPLPWLCVPVLQMPVDANWIALAGDDDEDGG